MIIETAALPSWIPLTYFYLHRSFEIIHISSTTTNRQDANLGKSTQALTDGCSRFLLPASLHLLLYQVPHNLQGGSKQYNRF